MSTFGSPIIAESEMTIENRNTGDENAMYEAIAEEESSNQHHPLVAAIPHYSTDPSQLHKRPHNFISIYHHV